MYVDRKTHTGMANNQNELFAQDKHFFADTGMVEKSFRSKKQTVFTFKIKRYYQTN